MYKKITYIILILLFISVNPSFDISQAASYISPATFP